MGGEREGYIKGVFIDLPPLPNDQASVDKMKEALKPLKEQIESLNLRFQGLPETQISSTVSEMLLEGIAESFVMLNAHTRDIHR